jgi:hypothetical protein
LAVAELTTEQIDALLSNLDFIAREHDMYEYGLPMHGADEEDGAINKLREAVRKWAAPVGVPEGVPFKATLLFDNETRVIEGVMPSGVATVDGGQR